MGVVMAPPPLKFLLLALIGCSSASAAKDVKNRTDRLFYVSTTSSTSTLLTQSICYATKSTIVVCTKKKKKRSLDDIFDHDSEDKIDPTGSSGELQQDVDELVDLTEDNELRAPRFLVYWMTTTKLSTSTSYTTTVTFASI